MIDTKLSPSELLESGHFDDWYPGQYELLLHMLEWYYSRARFLGVAVPTGMGKSLLGLLVTKLTDARTVILTATKGLMSQYIVDAGAIGGVEVKGRNNFRCLIDPDVTAEDGICNLGISCDLRDECPYRLQLSQAQRSHLVVTNYAYWLAQTNYAGGLGKVDLLICVPGETTVTLSDGSLRRIDDIVESRRKLSVRSVDLSTGELVESCISGWHKVECGVRLLRIETSVGFLDVTEDHEVWTSRGYVRARDIKKGDILYADTLESRAVSSGKSVGRRWPSTRKYSWGEPQICSEAGFSTEGLRVPEEACACRLGGQGTEGGSEPGLGVDGIHVCDEVAARTDAVLSALLSGRKEDRFPRVAGLGGRSGVGLVVHGRWLPIKEALLGADIHTRLWSRRECNDNGMVAGSVWYRDGGEIRQARKRFLSVSDLAWAGQAVQADTEVHLPRHGVQNHVFDPNGYLRSMWSPVSEDEERLSLFPRVSSSIPQRVECTVGAGATEVLGVEEVRSPRYVYDITVENTHNFFANGHLVRNCDEAHLAFSALEGFLTVFISRSDIGPLGIVFPTTSLGQWEGWRTWAEASTVVAEREADVLGDEVRSARAAGSTPSGAAIRAARRCSSLVSGLKLLSGMDEQWIVQRTPYGQRFVPKWVAHHTDDLFRAKEIPKVVLMSAILSHRSADYLGVPNNSARSWIEADSLFPAENTPIYHVDTARINYRTGDLETRLWVSRIDQIIQRRLDRKGIVFTVSYERAKLLLSRSRFKDIMLTHGTRDVTDVVDTFKESSPPVVLVSPAVTTGYDFPMQEQSQYIIIGKVPYPDTSDPVAQARHEDDKDWSSYIAMETLIQSCGRMSRSAQDRCEVLIVDDNIRWFMRRYGSFAPSWFKARYRGSLATVPGPLV